MTTIHATCLAVRVGREWRGILLRGKSGSGKSDLALRALELGARLVADDRVVVDATGGHVWASAPSALAGLLEIRGIGICRVRETRKKVQLCWVVDLVSRWQVERLPDADFVNLHGVCLPLVCLHAFDASSAHKLLRLTAIDRKL